MAKKGKVKTAKTVSKAKKTKKYMCDACGMIVSVDKECACDPCDIVCCGQDMTVLPCL